MTATVPVPAVVTAVKTKVFPSASVSLAITSLLVKTASSSTVNKSATATGASFTPSSSVMVIVMSSVKEFVALVVPALGVIIIVSKFSSSVSSTDVKVIFPVVEPAGITIEFELWTFKTLSFITSLKSVPLWFASFPMAKYKSPLLFSITEEIPM